MIFSMFGDFGFEQTVALGVGLVIAWYWYLTKDYGKWEAKGLHSVKPTFFLGNLKDVFLENKHLTDLHKEFYKKVAGHRLVETLFLKNLFREKKLLFKL